MATRRHPHVAERRRHTRIRVGGALGAIGLRLGRGRSARGLVGRWRASLSTMRRQVMGAAAPSPEGSEPELTEPSPAEQAAPLTIRDLSLTGCRFAGPGEWTPGEWLSLELAVPAYSQPICVDAEVIWSATQPSGESTDVGVRFLRPTGKAAQALARVIDDGKLRALERVRQQGA